jgi:flagellar protein FliS
MMSYTLARARYASDAAQTVTPARLLTMLYDRLVLDLAVAEVAMREQDYSTIGERVGQAQRILLELRASLDLSIWPDGEPLGRLYEWMFSELSEARLRDQPQRIADVRELVEPLRDAWHQAAQQLRGTRVGGGYPGAPRTEFGGAA